MLQKNMLLGSSIISFCLVLASSPLRTLASLGGFVSDSSDNSQKVAQRRSIGNGTRSKCKNSFPKNSITLLVPQEEVAHKTSKAKPVLYLQSKVTSQVPLTFSLIDPEVTQPLAQQNFTILKSGIKRIELPKHTKLDQGKIYLWYVAIPSTCDQFNTAQYQDVLASSVKFTPASSSIQQELKTVDHDTKAKIYAQNGFWYDSLETSINNKSTFLATLLKSANLN
jgi:hypothetical protein